MPKRPDDNKKVVEISYMELLTKIHTHLTESYGSIAAFTKHEDYKKCGFDSDKASINKFFNYLSIPRDGEPKKVMSVPTMAKLFQHFFGTVVEAKVEVIRTTKIYVKK